MQINYLYILFSRLVSGESGKKGEEMNF